MFLDVVLCCKISGELDLVSIGIDDHLVDFLPFCSIRNKKSISDLQVESKFSTCHKSQSVKHKKKNDTIYDMLWEMWNFYIKILCQQFLISL